MKDKPLTIFICTIPDICGYGIEAYGRTEAEAVEQAKAFYAKMRRDWELSSNDDMNTFERAMEYFGGQTRRIPVPFATHTGFSVDE